MAIIIDGTAGITFSDSSTLPSSTFSTVFPITASVASSALTVTLNPCALVFRNSSLTSGTTNTRTVSAAISVVVPSTATLGTVNAIQSRIVVIAIDNAGTVELAVVNISGGNNLDETTLLTTTTISSGSTSASTVYSTTGRTSAPFRVVGYIESTQATAGTWATAPSTIQGYGGQALAAMSSLGYGQTWQNVGASRALSTTYYNTTGKPIYVSVASSGTSGGGTLQGIVNGSTIGVFQPNTAATSQMTITFIVPVGSNYSVACTAAFATWFELR